MHKRGKGGGQGGSKVAAAAAAASPLFLSPPGPPTSRPFSSVAEAQFMQKRCSERTAESVEEEVFVSTSATAALGLKSSGAS